MTTTTKTTGTMVVRTMRAKKTGRVFKYEVYTASDGVTIVARMVEMGGSPVQAEWSGPHTDEMAAIKDAFHVYTDPRTEKRRNCVKCGGTGFLYAFRDVANGRCFECM